MRKRLDNMLRAIQGTLAGTLPSEEKLVRVYCLSLIAKAARNDEWYGEFSRMLPEVAVCGEVLPDIVLDDGSHQIDDVASSVRHLYPRLDRNGVYMVETCTRHTGKNTVAVRGARDLHRTLQATYRRAQRCVHVRNATKFTDSTLSTHFYDSIVVFERGRHGKRRASAIRGRAMLTDKVFFPAYSWYCHGGGQVSTITSVARPIRSGSFLETVAGRR